MPSILVALIVLMIIAALVAIETSNLLYSIISLGAIGFLLSIVFLFLSAPDLAITQIAVEVITLVILLRVASRAEQDAGAGKRSLLATVTTVAMLLVLVFFSARMFTSFPEFGQPVMDRIADAPSNVYLREGIEKTGAANVVTAVLLDYRGYDTLGEATVLFCAVMGALSILRHNRRKLSPETAEEAVT